MVLVAGQHLFAASVRAQGEPLVSAAGRAEVGLREIEQPAGEGVVRVGDGTADVHRVDPVGEA